MRGPTDVAILPALNEAPRIAAVLSSLRSTLPGIDIVVVDDGSADGTAAAARAAGAAVLRHPFTLGYGAALQTGYRYALERGYARCVQLDADGQHDPAVVPLLLRALDDHRADVAIASRVLGGAHPPTRARRLGARWLRWLSRTLGGLDATDPTSGFRALDRRALSVLATDPFPDDYPDLEVLLAMRREGLRLVEIPAEAHARPSGQSMHSGLRPAYYAYKVSLAGAITALRARRRRTGV